MGIQIKWNCNLDRAASFCLPRYSFRRLDTRDTAHNVSPGYNFRWVRAWAPCLVLGAMATRSLPNGGLHAHPRPRAGGEACARESGPSRASPPWHSNA